MTLRDAMKQAKSARPSPRRPQRPKPGERKPGRVTDIFRPEELDHFKNLLLFAQTIVEGWFAGKHRSLDFGSNAEFAEHKTYLPGDPVAHVDWKVYARSRKLVVRKYRDEKDLTSHLVVDVSRSMAYRGQGREPKSVVAARLAASLAYLMHRQGDKFALALFNERLVKFLPSGGTRRHLFDAITTLEEMLTQTRGGTEAHGALADCVPLFKRRGSVIVISDFFTDLDAFFEAIAQFLHRRFHILLLHVLDPDEYALPQVPLARFVDMEDGSAVQVAPDEIREAYTREMDRLVARLETECLRRGIEYHLLRTESPYRDALEAWVGFRKRSASPGRA